MSEINHGDRAHSLLGASSASRWMACPSSIRLTKDMPEETNEHAERGTAAHELGEKCIENGLNASEYLGEYINGFEVTEDMVRAVQIYVDYIESASSDNSEVYIEERVDLSHIEPSMFGTNDCAILNPFESIEIIDYKNGYGVVEAADNPQLLYYALGVARKEEVKNVIMTIVQPNADHPEGPIRSWMIPFHRLLEWEKELKKAVARVKKADKATGFEMTKSGKHCKYCKAAGFCDTLRNQAMEIAQAEFDDGEIVLPSPDRLNNTDLIKVLNSVDILESWVKDVRRHAHHSAETGNKIEGFKLVQKKANRKWRDENEVVAEFGDIMGDKLFDKKLLTPAKLEKVIGKESVKEFTFTPETGTALVPVTDRRKEIVPQVEEDFNDI